MPARLRVPVWLMGLSNLTYGLWGGVVAFAIPQLLSDRHVSESVVAGLTAVAFSPGFWAFLISPMLDVRFSRRTWATGLGLVAAGSLLAGFLNLTHLGLLEVLLTLGFTAAYLYQSALGGWFSTVTTAEEDKTLSIWMTVANVGGFGVMAIGCNQVVAHLSTLAAALVLSGATLVPMLVMPFVEAPRPDGRLAGESFTQFFADLGRLVKRRDVLVAVMLFAAPAGTFSLTNFLGGRGADFGATPAFVGLVGGVGVALGGIAGCFLFKPVSRLLPLRPLYLAIGFAGSLVTLAFVGLHHTPASYAVALIGENLLQSLAITVSWAITFDVVGQDNPLASTTLCLVNSAYGVPISYMLYVDAFGFRRHGMAGAFAADALSGMAAAAALGALLWWLARRGRSVRTA